MVEMGADRTPAASSGFIGRERELTELIGACESGGNGGAQLFLIHGEPGIGKTRLCDELCSRAKSRRMLVLWGKCWEGSGAPAYWPWIQIIRGYLSSLDGEQRKLLLESETSSDIIYEVAQIVPDLLHAHMSPRPPTNERLDPSEKRFRLFDAVTSFLKTAAQTRPMLLVLDDIHDADEASLAMLRFLARELTGAAIFVVVTYREVEVSRSAELSKLFGEISREGRSIPLRGFTASEVKTFVEVSSGRTPSDSLVSSLREATNGNPLFLDGIVRGLAAEGAIE